MKSWGKARAIIFGENVRKIMPNNPNLDLVNMKAYIKFGENQDIKKRPFEICLMIFEKKAFPNI